MKREFRVGDIVAGVDDNSVFIMTEGHCKFYNNQTNDSPLYKIKLVCKAESREDINIKSKNPLSYTDVLKRDGQKVWVVDCNEDPYPSGWNIVDVPKQKLRGCDGDIGYWDLCCADDLKDLLVYDEPPNEENKNDI